MRIAASAVILMSLAAAIRADTITSIDFQNVPSLPAGPILYNQAGAAQTIFVPNVATITGGVVLGIGSALASVAGVTSANVFATASNSIVGPGGFGLPDTITIDIADGATASEARVPVINGMQTAESYAVTAYAGSTQIGRQILTGIPSFRSGIADLTGSGITSVTITPLDTSNWDFATGTLTLTEAAQTSETVPPPTGSIQPPPVTIQQTPEPASTALAIAGLATTALLGRFRRQRV